MKKFLGVIVVIIAAIAVYWFFIKPKDKKTEVSEKQQPIKLKSHSDSFNNATEAAVGSYLEMKDAFVNADTATVKAKAREFMILIDSIPYSEIKNDQANIAEAVKSTVSDIKANTAALISQNNIEEMRKNFSSVSDLLYPGFLKMINYEGKKLYLQHCPMAFNDEIGANWLSASDEVVNPYLGKKHPKYKAGMLNCGEVMDSISTP
ncbi:MAG: DUF3347 domain-containing protein [Bacteroidetes bacterium]|nr:DUF3347 domain-containing protein [Bacteroidota bacterium]